MLRFLAALLTLLLAAAAGAQQDGDIERWKAALDQPGPEAAETRRSAIENLLGMLDLRAHGALQDRFRNPNDPDGVRLEILTALARRVPNEGDKVFGNGADTSPMRTQLIKSWVPRLLLFWGGEGDQQFRLAADPLRDAARLSLVKLPARAVEDGMRTMVRPEEPLGTRLAALRAAADTQNLMFAVFLADFIADPDDRVRLVARRCLQTLTFVREPFTDLATFQAWFELNKARRYVDLAEESGRGAHRLETSQVQQLQEEVIAARCELIVLLARGRASADWARVRARVLEDRPPGSTDRCLQALIDALRDELHSDNHVQERQEFHRALVAALNNTAERSVERRALLLEAAASVLRQQDGQPATDIAELLRQHLDSGHPRLQLAALRGLRRFPSARVRGDVVRAALRSLQDGAAPTELTATALRILGSKSEPAWQAPLVEDGDKALWLELLRTVLERGNAAADLRQDALAMALRTDKNGERIAEVFDLLLNLARSAAQPIELRAAAMVHLQGFLARPERFRTFLAEIGALLADADRDLRLRAAESLFDANVATLSPELRQDWNNRVLELARERLAAEESDKVGEKLIALLQKSGEAPGTPDGAVQALLVALSNIAMPAPPEQKVKVDAMLVALQNLASDSRSNRATWLRAGEVLQQRERLRLLRLLLTAQRVGTLAEMVGRPGTEGEEALGAMRLVLQAALRPQEAEVAGSEAARLEANDVLSAFAALDKVPSEEATVLLPAMRVLRLSTLLALGRHQDVVDRGNSILLGTARPSPVAFTPAQTDQVRALVTDAALQVGKLDVAARCLGEREVRTDAATVDQMERLAKALFLATEETAAAQASQWFEQVLKQTKEEDPKYRGRLLDLVRARLKADPKARDEAIAMLNAKAPLFEAADCPSTEKQDYHNLLGRSQ